MLRSFQYAVHSVLAAEVPSTGPRHDDVSFLLPWSERWLSAASAAFLAGYRERVAGSGLIPLGEGDFHAELEVCLLEKALYEVAYELDNRPTWVSVPLTGLAELLSTRLTRPGRGRGGLRTPPGRR